VALGAKLAPFGGWSMPLQYSGVVEEHTAVRTAVGLFDVSHLGKGAVKGPGAATFIDSTLTNSLSRIGPGQAQYTLCCDDATGGVVDDLIVYLRSDDDVFLIPNAANTAEVLPRLRAAAPAGIEVTDLHRDYAVLALQGPMSDRVLDALGIPHAHAYMSFVSTTWDGRDLMVCRTGYTGERGFELVVPSDDAAAVWDAVLAGGEAYGIRPCGLGARDTLRTEMGYPLHGQDLSLDITPVQARAGWAVGWKKPAFWGRDALLAEKERGPHRILRGLEALDRGIPRPHMAVLGADGAPVGEVTSGTFSPTRKLGIGLALLHPSVQEGDEVSVDVRGRASRMRVVRPPFVEASAK
jgi:aminomethyltransferase